MRTTNAKTFKLPFLTGKEQPAGSEIDEAASLPLRPILTHLNEDTTWLLLLPYPANTTPQPPCRYYRILFDPWLSGPQSDVYAWFSTQWHATPSSVETIAQLTDLIKSIDGEGLTRCGIDAVFISHEFTDHCHKETLLEIPKTIPIFASDNAYQLITSWKHFDTVLEPKKFPSLDYQNGKLKEWDWRTNARGHTGVLPGWMGITRIESPGNALYYHSSVMITFTGTASEEEILKGDEEVECILYTPHGTTYSTLEGLQVAQPKIKPLALLHGLHDVKLGLLRYKQLNLGAKNGIKCVRSCGGVKYWIGTHDEKKVAGGFIKKMLQRKAWTVKDIVDEQAERMGEDMRGRYIEVGNGETLVLE